MRKACARLWTTCATSEASVDEGVNYIILSDRDLDDTHAAIPSLLLLVLFTTT